VTDGNTTVTGQILRDVDDDDDDGVYLTAACYTMEDWRKGYEGTSSIVWAYNMIQ
jgi:hypothetical protein